MRRYNLLSKQHGYFSMLAVFLIIVIGFLGTTVAVVYTGSAMSGLYFHQAEAALYIADAGADLATRALYNTTLSGANSSTCAGLTANAALTNMAVGQGTFSANTANGNPTYASSTLSSSISQTDTVIPLTSTNGFTSPGRVMIDNENITYGSISGSNLVGANRNSTFNLVSSHASGAPVAQYQCQMDVIAGIPNLTSPQFKREILKDVQLQEAWTVGDDAAGGYNYVSMGYNRPTENTWVGNYPASGGLYTSSNLHSVAMLSNADGWAVGEPIAFLGILQPRIAILRFNGSTWSLATSLTPCTGSMLMGVSAVSSAEAWAVGTRITNSCTGSNYIYSIYKWDGSTWTQLVPGGGVTVPAASVNNQNLNAVHMIDTSGNGAANIGFAVGNNGYILRYLPASGWAKIAISGNPTTQLNAVFTVSTTEAWAVGAGGRIYRYTSGTWAAVASPTTTNLNAITMLDLGSSRVGWAVGDNGVIVFYNGSTWSTQSGVATTAALNGVALFKSKTQYDVWAVGNGGFIEHYNGSSWAAVASGIVINLNAISSISPVPYAYGWQEVFAQGS